ncbi:MAG: hypothetical protein EXR48_03055 [Dehalococcoidia bacterium]|nr:hypothetical protein [Dehalococcoidia bacterium]
MHVEFQYTGAAMARYSFYFSEERPHENDVQVLMYLAQNRLIPKRIYRALRNGEACRVMHYGQCYLGQHLDAVCSRAETGPVEVGNAAKVTLHPWENLPGFSDLNR